MNAAGGGTPALDAAASANARWIREDISWPAVEPIRGRQDWSVYDDLFLGAAQRGIHILPIIDEIPTWASGSTNTWTMPADPTAFATFTGQVTARYGPGGTFWRDHSDYVQYAPTYFEIWNEPWYPSFSDPVDPARYARLFKAAAIAGRAANPEARVIIAAEWQYHAANGSWRKWVDDMYAAVPDLNSYFDAFSAHPYGNGSVDNWTPGNGDAFETRRLEVIHDTFVAHGATAQKMWVTEVGWSTCLSGEECYTEAEQKQNLARFNQLAHTSWASFMAAVFYYRLVDLEGINPTNAYWYGAIRSDGSLKPAYDTLLAALASSL
ncbi:MAG: hypothetical protein ABSB96_11475 [Gaiellaceae bacterium]